MKGSLTLVVYRTLFELGETVEGLTSAFIYLSQFGDDG